MRGNLLHFPWSQRRLPHKTFFYCRETAPAHENRLRTLTLIVDSINFSYGAGRKLFSVSYR